MRQRPKKDGSSRDRLECQYIEFGRRETRNSIYRIREKRNKRPYKIGVGTRISKTISDVLKVGFESRKRVQEDWIHLLTGVLVNLCFCGV